MIKLSGYKIIKKIGSGGMGDVYLAEHEKLKKKVAIKSLHKNLVSNVDFRKRFTQEAQTHSKLDHSNIVKLLDYKERKDGLFLIMEYVDGKQLDQHIKQVSGPIPEQDLIPLFTQVLDAIGYAHKQGLIHRDIKPSNIMLNKDGGIKVLDFGIAKLQEEEKGLTKTGMQIGTASYMSPEQVNTKKVTKLTDIYSLGVTLFYMAVGKSPYDGETNTFNIQTKIVSEIFPLASEVYPGVSKKIESIITQATQKKKVDRYQSCQDFLHDLSPVDTIISSPTKNLSKSSGLVVFVFIALAIAGIKIGSDQVKLNDKNMILEQKNTDIFNLEDEISSSKRTIVELNKEITTLNSKISDLEKKLKKQSCTKRTYIYYDNHTNKKLLLYMQYKEYSWSRDWSTETSYWTMDPGASGRLITYDSKDFKAVKYRYYVTTSSGSYYYKSYSNMKYSDVCHSSTIDIR